MITLTDKLQDKNIKIGIDGLSGPISKRISNHNGAWAHKVLNQCINAGYTNIRILDKGEKLHEYDAIILYLGISYEGTLNENVLKIIQKIILVNYYVFNMKCQS